MQETLNDTKNGKTVDWKGRKLSSLGLADSFERLELFSKSDRVRQCGDTLDFKEYEGEMKLHKANFCKVRICPMCAWRRSLKVFGQVSKVMDYLESNYEYRYIFLTLTVRNVPGDELSNEIDKLFKAFNSMTKRKAFKAVSKGWFRCLEVTHNQERDDYHPHFHMIIAVNKSYFKDKRTYISWDGWIVLWKSCLGIDYEPVVDIRTVKPDAKGKESCKKAVAEVAKYAVKAGDYLIKTEDGYMDEEKTDEAVLVIDEALHGRRLIANGGKFKEVHKLLSLDDVEQGDLINTDNEDELREDLNYILVRYAWMPGFGNYIRVENKNEG